MLVCWEEELGRAVHVFLGMLLLHHQIQEPPPLAHLNSSPSSDPINGDPIRPIVLYFHK